MLEVQGLRCLRLRVDNRVFQVWECFVFVQLVEGEWRLGNRVVEGLRNLMDIQTETHNDTP